MITADTIDIILLVILFLSMLWGLMEGMFLALLGLGIWVAHVVLLIIYTPVVAKMITGYAPSAQPVSYWSAIIAISVVVLIAGFIIKMVLRLVLALMGQSMIGRLVGAAIGLIRGIILELIIILIVASTAYASNPAWQGSRIVKILSPYSVQVYQVWNEHMKILNQANQQAAIGLKQWKL